MNEKDFNSMVSGLIQNKVKEEKKSIKKQTHRFFKVWVLIYFVLLIGWVLFK